MSKKIKKYLEVYSKPQNKMTELSLYHQQQKYIALGSRLDPEAERNRAATIFGVKHYMTELHRRMQVSKSLISLAFSPDPQKGNRSKKPTRLYEIHKLLNRLENSVTI